MVQSDSKILLHACCAICSGYPIKELRELGYETTIYFCNPNLDTQEEFDRRLEAQKTLCTALDSELVVEHYNHSDYLEWVHGLEHEPERGKRCIKCIELRLEQTAKKAKELGITTFTTSLPISPHKNFELISNIGNKMADKFGINYLAYNFRKKDGFLKTNKISKDLNLYRQNYCGCEFSKNC